MHKKRPPPGAGGDVGHGVCAHAQGRTEEIDGVHRPARACIARQVEDAERPQRVAAPGSDGGAVHHLPVGAGGAEPYLRSGAGRQGHGVLRRDQRDDFAVGGAGLALHLDGGGKLPIAHLRAQIEQHVEVGIAEHGHGNAFVLGSTQQGADVRRHLAVVRVEHHGGIAPGQRLGDGGRADKAVFGHQAEVFQRHGAVEMCALRLQLGAVALLAGMQQQHAAWHQFHRADAQAFQRGVGHPGDESIGGDLLRGLAGQCAVAWRAVVDGDAGQLELAAHVAKSRQQPFAVCGRHLHIGRLALIPAAVQRLGRDRQNAGRQCGVDQFETAIEHQADAGKRGNQPAQRLRQRLGLSRLLGGRLGQQLIGVEGIEKEGAEPGAPQRLDDALAQKLRPARRGLIDHLRTPGRIRRGQPGLGHIGEIGPVRGDFAHRDIGQRQRVRPEGGDHVRVLRQGVRRFEHHPVEGAQIVHRNARAVVKSNGGLIGSLLGILKTVGALPAGACRGLGESRARRGAEQTEAEQAVAAEGVGQQTTLGEGLKKMAALHDRLQESIKSDEIVDEFDVNL